MNWIFMLCPGVLSVCIIEKLQQKHFSPLSFFKSYATFTFFINFFSALIYHYIIKTETSIIDNFIYNNFLVHYAVLALFLAVVLPIIYLIFSPWFSIKLVTNKETKESESQLAQKSE